MKLKQIFLVFTILAFSTVVSSCKDQQTVGKQEAPPATAQQAAEQTAPPQAVQPQPEGMIAGKVLETFASGGYTYLKVDSNGKEIWAAIPQTEVKAGEEVKLAGGQIMKDFHSKTLDRTFDEIAFCGGIISDAPAGAPQQMPATGQAADNSFGNALQSESAAGTAQQLDPAKISMGSSKAAVPFADLKIEKATGADSYTVGELFTKSADLNGKKVRVKGQVVKFTANIMGKNWLHIQDGTGDPQQNTHDLVATCNEQAEKGDVVTIEGVLAANKDFGYGYKYNVIVEDVKVTR